MHSLTHPFTHLFTHAFTHSPIHSFIHQSIHPILTKLFFPTVVINSIIAVFNITPSFRWNFQKSGKLRFRFLIGNSADPRTVSIVKLEPVERDRRWATTTIMMMIMIMMVMSLMTIMIMMVLVMMMTTIKKEWIVGSSHHDNSGNVAEDEGRFGKVENEFQSSCVLVSSFLPSVPFL